VGGGGGHHILWRWRPVETVAGDGGGDRGSASPLAVRPVAAGGLITCLSLCRGSKACMGSAAEDERPATING
jgi:hypothetical protein